MGSASSIMHAGDRLDKEQQDELIKNIYDESERLNLLVNNILKIIRLEAGSVEISKQPYDIKQLLTSVLDKLRKRFGENKFVVNAQAQDTPFVMLDNLLMEQVLINLIENAVKYSSADTTIAITIQYSATEVKVMIADRGKGIARDEVEKVFDKFYRGPKADADSGGFGLGLAICKGIVLAHHGRIFVEPRENGGTIFCFTLPLAA
jgi:two-component system sensor histidine kinase KdpD